MKLVKVEIEGFRSIKKMELEFDGTGHKILVGKNESGKSNILKALNLLEHKKNFEDADKKSLHNGATEVKFYFKLTDEKINEIEKEFYGGFYYDENTTLTENLTIGEFFKEYSEYIYYTKKPNGEGTWTIKPLSPKLKLASKWFTVTLFTGSSATIELFVTQKQLDTDGNNPADISYHEGTETGADLKNMHYFLGVLFQDAHAFPAVNPPVINWEYNSETHDLPTSINVNDFLSDPNSCIPLKNMFLLSGIKFQDIPKKLSEAIAKKDNAVNTIYDDISGRTNSHIKKYWRSYSGGKIKISPNGENISIGVKDSRTYFDFDQRSYGFRRFISFLLSIGTLTSDSESDVPLILIDEPEIGLHPSAARDLKNRIIELGKDSLIVYATHSISMIDTDNTKNNLIVTKENENTSIEKPRNVGISSAEIVYQAIGYSIYYELKKENVLVEGHTDKAVLELFMIGDKWKQYGICFAEGVSKMKSTVIPLLDLANRKYFVLADSDQAANDIRKALGDPPHWSTYEDLGSKAITIEDFYKGEFFRGIVTTILGENNITIPENQSKLFTPNDRLKSIRSYLDKDKHNSKGEYSIKEILGKIKNECASNVTKKDVDGEKLQPILDSFLEKIEKEA